jgi:hypothetical protein
MGANWRTGAPTPRETPRKEMEKNIERGLTRDRNRRILAIVNGREGNNDRTGNRSGW